MIASSAFDLRAAAPVQLRGLPSSTLTLIVMTENPVEVRWTDEQIELRSRSFVAGLHVIPASVGARGRIRGLQIDLTPRSASRLLGVGPGELAGAVVALEDVAPGLEDRIGERLVGSTGSDVRLGGMARLLQDWAHDARSHRAAPLDESMATVWRQLVARRGRITAAEAARIAGYGQRHFRSRFRASFGIGPKQAIRLVRHESARTAMRATPRRSLSSIAAEVGYADHAHLSREFRTFTGMTPSGWLEEELRFVQGTS